MEVILAVGMTTVSLGRSGSCFDKVLDPEVSRLTSPHPIPTFRIRNVQNAFVKFHLSQGN